MAYPWRAPITPRSTMCDLKPLVVCSYENCQKGGGSYSIYLQRSEKCTHRSTTK